MQDKNMKVLLCSPYNATDVGGISIWTKHLLKYYENIKSNVELKHYYTDEKGASANTPFYVRLYLGVILYLPFLVGLKKKLKSENYDLVHFVSSASVSLIRDLISIIISRNRGVKTIVHFRFGRIYELYEKRNWEQKLLHQVINLADKAIVIDQTSFDTLIKEGYTNIELLSNPLSTQVVEIIKKNSSIEKEDRKLVFAGHVVKTKGVFELIEACKSIQNIKLIIIGQVTDVVKSALMSSAGSGNTDWLEIRGELSFEETIKQMLSAGVFVLPTYTEGFPNVIIESMACACPIVTTNVGAIPEMLDIANGYKNGICVAPRDVHSLRVAIQKMIDDREYAVECGRNAQKRVNNMYSMPQVWNQLEAIWRY